MCSGFHYMHGWLCDLSHLNRQVWGTRDGGRFLGTNTGTDHVTSQQIATTRYTLHYDLYHVRAPLPK